MTWSEAEIRAYLKRGVSYKDYLRERRHFLEKEIAEAGGEMLREELASLRDEENSYCVIMSAMWHLEPEDRELLLALYEGKNTARAVASDLDISDATLWRRRKRAFAALEAECGKRGRRLSTGGGEG